MLERTKPQTTFARKINWMNQLREMASPDTSPNWMKDLLNATAPAGTVLTDSRFLRVAVRDNYLNFYHKGQSIALVKADQNRKLKFTIHAKYVFPNEVSDQSSCVISDTETELYWSKGDKRRTYHGGFTLKELAANSVQFGKVEKDGVDDIVAVNPSVVDLEIAIPAWTEQNEDANKLADSKKFAPRMDLAALHLTDGQPTIVFWEAKRLRDDRLRKNDENVKVLSQLRLYQAFLNRDHYRLTVAQQYENCCKILCQVHDMMALLDPSISAISPLVRQVATKGISPNVDSEPRLVIVPGWDREKCAWEVQTSGFEKHENSLRVLIPLYRFNTPHEAILTG